MLRLQGHRSRRGDRDGKWKSCELNSAEKLGWLASQFLFVCYLFSNLSASKQGTYPLVTATPTSATINTWQEGIFSYYPGDHTYAS